MSIAFVGTRTYQLWQEGPRELPRPAKGQGSSVIEEPRKEIQQPQLANTKNIVEKNLFDPERGASQTKEAEASSMAMQRVRNMVLLGTAILGDSRYAILESPSDARPPVPGAQAQAGQPNRVRLKLGDSVEGFKLSEIQEKRVVFTKGASRIEVALDFFRRADDSKPKAPTATPPRAVPAPRVQRPQTGQGPTPSANP